MYHRTLLIGLLALGTIVCMAQTNRQELSPEVRELLETKNWNKPQYVQNQPERTEPPDPSPEVKALLDRIGSVIARPKFDRYNGLSSEEKGLLIEHFREQKRRAEESKGPGFDLAMEEYRAREANRALVLLSDPEMIESLLRKFSEIPISDLDRETGELLLLISDPKALQQLAPEMEKEEPLEYFERDHFASYVPKSYTAAKFMLRIVANSSAFEGNTRKWAADNEWLGHTDRMVVLRPWWKENKALIEAGDYKSVKPGEQLMAVRGQELIKERERDAVRNAKLVAEEAARQVASTASTAAPTGSTTPRSVATANGGWGAFGYALAALLVLCLVAALMFYGRSARHV